MAPQSAIQSFSSLRVITHRISTTPSSQLPHVAQYLAASIASCRNVLRASEKGGQNADESSVLVHKLKTQLSALLQDKSAYARYSAVILIKATVEAGGWSILQSSGPWIRGLVGILGRPDHTSTKKLCIITLTRIFRLTQDHQSLVRELTTPALAGFITACLNLVKTSGSSQVPNPLLLTVFQAFSELIALHPTSFRPYVPQIQAVILPLVAPTPSAFGAADEFKNSSGPADEAARCLFVLLHVCGPKGTAGEGWAKSLQTVLASAQKTADRVFRALVEDWRPQMERADVSQSTLYGEVVSDEQPGPLALPGWTGIYAGIERLDGLLQTVHAFVASTTSAPVVFPVSSIMNLVDRVLSALQPSSTKSSRNRLEISKDEREGLFAGLPQLHVSTIGILTTILSRMSHGFAAISHIALDQALWALENEHYDERVRKEAYLFVSQLLSTFGPSLPRYHTTSLSRCIKLACADLLPSEENSEQVGENSANSAAGGKGTANGAASGNADSYLKPSETRRNFSSPPNDVLEAARRLLPLTLTNLPGGFLSYAVRCQIDRTAILTNDKEAMLASVMSPVASAKGQKAVSNILPLLVRAYPEALEVEALLRPRMPVLQARRADLAEAVSDEDEDMNAPVYNVDAAQDPAHGEAFGFNGGRNVGKPPAEPKVVKDQVAPSFDDNGQLAQVTRPQSPFAVSYISSKRDREDDLGFDNDAGDISAAAPGSTEIEEGESPSKKLRFTNGEQLISVAKAPQIEVPTQAASVPTPTTLTTATPYGASYNEDQGDSDESDFVMPTLNMDPDTDEEEDEEDEDDG